ncbi:hypothetical protein ABZ630_02195 [Streptomyces albidoflavus]|uniref:hypothetical protein n=1 Tax=Streptomyces albidoflavus TaxID=1886 RepID=UPI0033F21671
MAKKEDQKKIQLYINQLTDSEAYNLINSLEKQARGGKDDKSIPIPRGVVQRKLIDRLSAYNRLEKMLNVDDPNDLMLKIGQYMATSNLDRGGRDLNPPAETGQSSNNEQEEAERLAREAKEEEERQKEIKKQKRAMMTKTANSATNKGGK